jgi:hypothetical protein
MKMPSKKELLELSAELKRGETNGWRRLESVYKVADFFDGYSLFTLNSSYNNLNL